jgi:hypothetical protein
MIFSPRNCSSVIQRVFALTASCAALVAFGGCGNGLAKVTGLVTLDGQPLHGGKGDTRVTVQFQPVDGVGANAVGLADEDGKYKIATGSQTGIRPGDYYVTCAVSTLKAGGPVADPKYANAKTSGLKITVQSGKNEFNIPLQSAPKKAPRTSG